MTDLAFKRRELQCQLEDFWANGTNGKAFIEIGDKKFMLHKGDLYQYDPEKIFWKSITRNAFDKMRGVI